MAQWAEPEARKRINKARSDKEASDEIYREAMELTFPDRENFTKRQEGQSRATYNWDSASTISVIRAANRMSNDFTPQFQSWLEIKMGPAAELMPDAKFQEALGKTKAAAKQELEGITKIVQAVFNGPGFPTASNELYIDWHYGQGGMMIMPNDDQTGEPVIFTAMPMSHFYAYEGPNGRLDQWFFWHELRADVVETQWPDAVLCKKIEDEKKKPQPGLIQLCSVVYRDYAIRGAKVKPYRYEVFCMHGSSAERIVQRQYRTSPCVTPRYSKLSGENRGRGPVLFALPDIRTANKIVELTLRAAAVAVAGVYTAVDQAITGPVNIKPYSVISVRSNGGPNGPSLARLDSPQRIDYGELLLEKLQDSIKKIIGDHSLPPEAGPIRTATEFVQRARELIADQAGGLGRLLAEFIIPGTQRVVDILETKQILPTEGLTIDQFLVEIRMTSPLARGEAMGMVENIVRFIEILLKLGGAQVAMLEVNMERTAPMIGDLMDIPMELRNTVEEKQKIKKGMAQTMAAEAGGDPNEAAAVMDQEEVPTQ